MNANLNRADTLVMGAVKDKDLTSPPISPSDGHRYIVGASATGSWSGHDGKVAVYESSTSSWTFYTPKHGWRVRVVDEGITYAYSEATSVWYPDSAIYNVMDFASVAAAIAAVPAGGRLYFPDAAGPYTPPSAAGWTLSSPIEIFSDGRGKNGAVNGFRFYDAGGGTLTKNSVVFNLASDGIYLHDLVIKNNAGKPATGGTGDAIRHSGASNLISNFTMERVDIFYAGRNGVRFNGDDYGIHIHIRDCRVYGCRGPGLYFNTCNVVHLQNVNATLNSASKLASELHGSCYNFIGCSEVVMIGCVAEESGEGLTNATYDCYVLFENCHNPVCLSTHIEDQGSIDGAAVRNGIVLNSCKSAVVGGSGIGFPNDSDSIGSIGINLVNTTKGCSILANEFAYVDKIVVVDTAANDVGNFIAPQMVNASHATNGPGKIVIPADHRCFVMVNNLTSGVADNKGVGILLPCMSAAADIDSSILLDGLLFYDTNDNKLKIRAGGSTVAVH